MKIIKAEGGRMTIKDDFNIYYQFDKMTAYIRQIASEKGIDLSRIVISQKTEKPEREKARDIWNIN